MKTKMKRHTMLMAAASLGLASTSFAALTNYTLPGTSDLDGWDNLTVSNPQVVANGSFPGFPGSGPWPEPIESVLTRGTPTASDDDPTGDATFDKVLGNGYPAGSSIYASPFEPAGTFTVADDTPVADLEQVIFQIEVGEGSDGFLDGDPTLTVNGSTSVALDDSGILSSVFDPDGDFGPLTINTLAYQWDLSSLPGPITDFNVDYTLAGTSVQIYEMQLDQGDSFSAQVVPEPSAFAAIAGLIVLGLVASRRRRRVW